MSDPSAGDFPWSGIPSASYDPLKILTIHNRYKYRGGEDESREAEDAMLRQNGHDVREVVFDNADIAGDLVRIGLQATWSAKAYARVCDCITDWRPDLLDVHNFFPLASPAVYYAARKHGVPVVQTLHNYRLFCPGATLFRDGHVCEDCSHRLIPWPGVVHRCYRGSALQTGAVALMTTTHRLLGTWRKLISVYFAISQFSRQKFLENGYPESQVLLKPNFVVDPGHVGSGGDHFLFVGRLSPEKGIGTMLKAVSLVKSPEMRLRIIGDGPLENSVREAALRDPRITYVGRVPLREVMHAMGSARAVLVPSEWYEPFGRVAAEALAVGTPVICAGMGGVAEIVENEKTGFHVRPLDPADLARVLDLTMENPGLLDRMRRDARMAYEESYTPERGYHNLMRGYLKAVGNSPAPVSR